MRNEGEVGMRLTDEMVLQDNKRFKQCNALAELKYCGWEIPHRKSITNDEIRFYAWLCRSAVGMLKEQKTVEPFHLCVGNSFSLVEDSHFDYCPYCGKSIAWEGH